jgi:hypothetical protein
MDTNLVATFCGGPGRVFSSRDLRRSHVAVFVFKQKTARPELNQARRLNKNDVVICICCVTLYPVSRSSLRGALIKNFFTFQITHFQFRKVHENLVTTQPARKPNARFFCDLGSLTHIRLPLQLPHLCRRAASHVLDQV